MVAVGGTIRMNQREHDAQNAYFCILGGRPVLVHRQRVSLADMSLWVTASERGQPSPRNAVTALTKASGWV
jgi:hypothetical protein